MVVLENVCEKKIAPGICEKIETEDINKKVSESDLIVNATPLGTHEGDPAPVDLDLLKEGMVVYDLVYARETELLKAAKQKELKCANGLGMLINQGALAFEIWTQKPFEEIRDVMKKAVAERE